MQSRFGTAGSALTRRLDDRDTNVGNWCVRIQNHFNLRQPTVKVRSPVLLMQLSVLLAAGSLLTACSSGGGPDPKLGVSSSPRVYGANDRIPKGGGTYKLGKPYMIGGRGYTPHEQPDYDESGIASWYGEAFHGRKTANGEIYDMNALTAAHPTLPLPSYAYVTNLENGRTVLVRINDRGPYVGNRVIDLSRASAQALGTKSQGLGRVRVRYAGRAPLNGDDRHERQFLARQTWAGAPVMASAGAPYTTQAQRTYALAAQPVSVPPAETFVQPAAPRGAATWSVMNHRSAGLGGGSR